jgi:soluble lytic murein transglycosylase-like protein
MQGVQTRLAEIENQTGISFSSHMMRSQLLRSVKGRAADGVAENEYERDTMTPEFVSGPDHEAALPVGTGGFARLPASSYDGLFAESADRYGLNAALIKAVCFAESGFRPGAVSGAGAMGLMQLMPYTAEALGVDDPFDPAQNVDGGARLLAQLLDRFNGDSLLAAAAYNCGAGGVSSRGITDLSDAEQRGWLPAETRGYLTRIEEYLGAAQALYVLNSPYAA